jgi:formate dehydrogenase iron-sulfur subunit
MSIRSPAILTDVTRCTGCEACVKACQLLHELPKERAWPWVRNIDDLSHSRWTTLVRVESERGSRFVRRHCRHCVDPECVSVCIVGALKKTKEGPVVYDPDLCIGCRYCMIACPWEIPRYSWEEAVPFVQKCDLCYERTVNEGKLPACVEACPEKATIFGERDELLAEAHRRIKAHPGRYVDHVWGEKEVGGTSVLYISDVELNLSDLERPVTDEAPMPRRTTKILHQMPLAFVGMAALMGGVYWVIDRRRRLMGQDQAGEAEPESAGEDVPSRTDGDGGNQK